MSKDILDIQSLEGIDVEFNGKKSVIEVEGKTHEYAVGEMLCELMRLDIFSLKDILMKVPGFNDAPNKRKMLEAITWVRDEMRGTYPPMISEMVFYELLDCVKDYYLDDSDEYREECICGVDSIYALSDSDELGPLDELYDHAFNNSGYDGPGAQTVGQYLLTMYLEINLCYTITRRVFDAVVNPVVEETEQERHDRIIGLLAIHEHLQEIKYCISFYDNRFNSVFTIRTMTSLCLFELAHVCDGNVPIVKCKHCGQYFVPRKRSDTLYCSYPAPDDPERTCKEIGAQKTWAKKEQTDDTVKAYRKVYMRYKMKVNRHPEDMAAREQLDRLTEGIKEWRQRISKDEAGKNEFIRWLDSFD